MVPKKTNVFLSSAYNLYGLSGCKQCGYMDIESLNEYRKSLKNIDIPASSCIKALSIDFHQTDNIDKTDKTSTARLIVSVWPVAPKCAIQDCAKCTTNIINGKCTDAFVVDLIGKQFFADKYAKQK